MNRLTRADLSKNYAIVVLTIMIIAMALALFGVKLNSPPRWLSEWTLWIAQFAGSATALWGVVKLIGGTENWIRAKARSIDPRIDDSE